MNPKTRFLDPRHPMMQPLRPVIVTPPVEDVANMLTVAVQQNLHGMWLDGNTRRGKSSTMVALAETLDWRAFPMQFFHVHFGLHKVTSENYMYSTLLSCAGIAHGSVGDAPRLLGRVATDMALKADKAGADVVVVSFDESQRLLPEDYEHLHTLDNALRLRNKFLFAVLIRQIDFKGKAFESILKDIPPHAKARFGMRGNAFIPIYRWTELEDYLAQYDEALFWPIGSGIAYSQYFAPKAYANGWRLHHQAKDIWDCALAKVVPTGVDPGGWAWQMQTLESVAAHLLTAVAGPDENFERFTQKQIEAALDASGFLAFEKEFPQTLDPRIYVVGDRLTDYADPRGQR
jgi:hypothetical protein